VGYKFKVCIVTACAVVHIQTIFRIGYFGMFLLILRTEFRSFAIKSNGKIILYANLVFFPFDSNVTVNRIARFSKALPCIIPASKAMFFYCRSCVRHVVIYRKLRVWFVFRLHYIHTRRENWPIQTCTCELGARGGTVG